MVYPRKQSLPGKFKGVISNTLFVSSKNGWINTALFLQWFQFFLSNIPPPRPVLLIMDGHSSHVSIDLIEVARDNNIHLLCLPSHTTHFLQPLDVGIFKSFKSNSSKACTKYLAANPGRVITSDRLASLVAEAWPHSLTPLNVMSGFKKCGIFPLNPSEITDRQIAPSKAVHYQTAAKKVDTDGVTVNSNSPLFSPEKQALYRKRYEEGYDVDDPGYIAWLKINHPADVSSICTGSSSSSVVTASQSSTTGLRSSSSTKSSSADVLAEVLSLPHPPERAKSKRKPALNSKAVCITEDEILEELKKKEYEKTELEKEKEAKKMERIQKKEEKQLLTEQRKREKEQKQNQKRKEGRKTRPVRKANEEKVSRASMQIVEEFTELQLSSASEAESDNAICPKCGAAYAESQGLWVCCDGCDRWFDVECTTIKKKKLPEVYFCEDCTN